ncbi:MAG: hypothetical protein AAF627_09900 [Myxococcota bacterium]
MTAAIAELLDQGPDGPEPDPGDASALTYALVLALPKDLREAIWPEVLELRAQLLAQMGNGAMERIAVDQLLGALVDHRNSEIRYQSDFRERRPPH